MNEENTSGIETASRLFRVHTTCTEMAQDRGYDLATEGASNTLEDFRARYQKTIGEKRIIDRDAMAINCVHRETGDSMCIFFCGDDTLTADIAKKYNDMATQIGAKRLIIVYANKIAAMTRKTIEANNRSEMATVKVQLFHEDDVVVNITKHELVPKHTPLSDSEVKEVLEAHSLKIQMLPRMLSTDPVALYFGLERGRVVKISRKSESAGVYVTYRQVV